MRNAGWLRRVVCFAFCLMATAVRAEEPTMEEVLREMRALKERVRELEGRLGHKGAGALGDDPAELERAIDDYLGRVRAPGVRSLAIGGQVRIQAENQLDYDFDESSGDANEFVGLRTRIYFDVDIEEKLRAFLKFQDSRFFGSEHSVAGYLGNVDLKEGFVDFRRIFGEGSVLRVGRQELLYGDQRLVSTLDWSNVGRSWDGARLMFDGEDGSFLHFFVTRIDERFLTAGQDESEDFLGIYGSLVPGEGQVLDGYVFFRRNQDADEIVAEDGEGGHEKLATVGGRYAFGGGGFDGVAEAAIQTGDFAGDDVMAFMGEVVLGYTFVETPLAPRIAFGLIFASGDDDPDDGDRGTFDPLYPFGHSHLGYLDRVGRRNILSPRIEIDLAPAPGVNISLDLHAFWLDSSRDALYHAGGGVLRAGRRGADDYVGSEIDLTVRMKLLDHLVLWAGYGHFFAGKFLDDTGSADDANFFFVQLTVDF